MPVASTGDGRPIEAPACSSCGKVIARLGDRPDPDFGNELWRLLMAARLEPSH